MTIRNLTLIAIAALPALGVGLAAGSAHAGNVENMERERAIMMTTLVDPDLTPEERAAKTETSMRRLVDLERLVLRDQTIDGKASPVITRAFKNYELTFIVHASSEKRMAVVDTWLEQVGITTQSLMAAQRKRR